MPDMTSFRQGSWATLGLSAGGLLLLVSLYLPWQSTGSCKEEEFFGNQSSTVCELLDYFPGGRTIDGLSSDVGRAAALFALLLAAVAAAGWARPALARRLPLGRCALLAGYFGIAVAVQTRSDADQQGFGGAFHFAYGAYVGLAAAIVVLVAAGVERRGELARYRTVSRLAMLLLAGGLLAAFLLRWLELESLRVDNEVATFPEPGIASSAAVIAAALALCLPAFWSRSGVTAAERLGLAAAIAAFTGGAAVSSTPLLGDRAYGLWVALGFAGGLLLLALVDGLRGLRLAQASWRQLAVCAAVVLFLGALFLPWQRWCYGTAKEFGPLAGRCLSADAWATSAAAAAGVLAIGLVVAVLEPSRVPLPAVELAAGISLLVATVGFQLRDGPFFELAYGSAIGFALAAVLIALALVGSRMPTVDWRRLAVRLAPIAACAGYLAIVVLPWWNVLPDRVQSKLSFAPLSLLTIAGVLIGIHLLGLWARQIRGPSGTHELVLLPLGLLALAAIDLIADRDEGLNLGGGAVLGLCVVLAVLGRIEQGAGLEKMPIPEILRIDRL